MHAEPLRDGTSSAVTPGTSVNLPGCLLTATCQVAYLRQHARLLTYGSMPGGLLTATCQVAYLRQHAMLPDCLAGVAAWGGMQWAVSLEAGAPSRHWVSGGDRRDGGTGGRVLGMVAQVELTSAAVSRLRVPLAPPGRHASAGVSCTCRRL